MAHSPIQKFFARFLSLLILIVGFQSSIAQAAIVGTQELVAQESASMTRTQILTLLDQEEAKQALTQLGVDKNAVEQRVDNMTAEELQAFNDQLQEMQAGGDIVIVILVVFLILILLDLLGTTNIFPAINPVQIN